MFIWKHHYHEQVLKIQFSALTIREDCQNFHFHKFWDFSLWIPKSFQRDRFFLCRSSNSASQRWTLTAVVCHQKASLKWTSNVEKFINVTETICNCRRNLKANGERRYSGIWSESLRTQLLTVLTLQDTSSKLMTPRTHHSAAKSTAAQPLRLIKQIWSKLCEDITACGQLICTFWRIRNVDVNEKMAFYCVLQIK